MTARSTRSRRIIALALLPVGASGCGDPLHGSDFAGHPIAVLDGRVTQRDGEVHPVPEGARVALFWRGDDGAWLQGAATGVAVTDGSTWRIPVYRAPPDEALGAGFAIGRVLPFVDVDGDGRRGADEVFHATPDEAVVLWSADGIDPAVAPVTVPLPPGLHRVFGQLPCGGAFPRGTETCGPRFGAACGECDEGAICTAPAPGGPGEGSCLYAEGACAPASARLVPDRTEGGDLRRLWMPDCVGSGETACPPAHVCSAASGTCVPGNALRRVAVSPTAAEPTVCPDPADDDALAR